MDDRTKLKIRMAVTLAIMLVYDISPIDLMPGVPIDDFIVTIGTTILEVHNFMKLRK